MLPDLYQSGETSGDGDLAMTHTLKGAVRGLRGAVDPLTSAVARPPGAVQPLTSAVARPLARLEDSMERCDGSRKRCRGPMARLEDSMERCDGSRERCARPLERCSRSLEWDRIPDQKYCF